MELGHLLPRGRFRALLRAFRQHHYRREADVTHEDLHLLVQAVVHHERVGHADAMGLHGMRGPVVCTEEVSRESNAVHAVVLAVVANVCGAASVGASRAGEDGELTRVEEVTRALLALSRDGTHDARHRVVVVVV